MRLEIEPHVVEGVKRALHAEDCDDLEVFREADGRLGYEIHAGGHWWYGYVSKHCFRSRRVKR